MPMFAPDLLSQPERHRVSKIVSGGQTGADQAALDVARELGIEHGGWIPKGRWTEAGPLDVRYRLRETPSTEPEQRTEWNVRDADATLILAHGRPRGGTALTARWARRYRKPLLCLDLRRVSETEAIERVRQWLDTVRPQVLNVAGPRASTDPDIYRKVYRILLRALM